MITSFFEVTSKFLSYLLLYIRLAQSIHSRCGKCAKCQIFGTFTTSNIKRLHLSDVANLINYATLNSSFTYLHHTDEMWDKFIIFLFDFSLSSHFFNSFFLSPTGVLCSPHNLSLSPKPVFFIGLPVLMGFGFSGFQLLCFLGLVNGFSMFSVFFAF